MILNRVRSPQFPQTICGVVYQGQTAPGCQFPFACDRHTDMPKEDDQWALAQELARKITSGQVWLPELGYSTGTLHKAILFRARTAMRSMRPPNQPAQVVQRERERTRCSSTLHGPAPAKAR